MDQLRFIRVPAPSPNTDDEKTNAALFGKVPDLEVAIHIGASPDADLTAESGRQRYRNTLMIAKRNAGEKDYISEPMTDEHKAMFPKAWAWWQGQVDSRSRVSVALLPAITPADLAELHDMKIADVDTLADFAGIPVELEGWQAMARRLRSLSKPRYRLIDGGLEAVA